MTEPLHDGTNQNAPIESSIRPHERRGDYAGRGLVGVWQRRRPFGGMPGGIRQRGGRILSDGLTLAALAGEAQEVVQREAEFGDGRAEFEGVVRTMPVVVMESECETS